MCAAVIAFGLLAACDPPRTRAVTPSNAQDSMAVETQPLTPASVTVPVVPEARTEAPARVDRATALTPTVLFALAQGSLYRVENGRWKALPVAGLSLRDVTAAYGFIWVLARGVGANAGVTTILRSSGADDLAVAATARLDERWEPRVLTVARHGDFYIGGRDPSLVRVRGPLSAQTVSPYNLPKPVDQVASMPGEVVVLRYEDGTRAAFRWGETRAIERPNYLTSFVGVREMLTLTRDGTVWRGLLWELPVPEAERLTSAPGFTPALVTTLRDGRILEVDDGGRAKVHSASGWSSVEAPAEVAEPAALVGTGALTAGLAVLVDRGGRVYEFDGTRWVSRVERLTNQPSGGPST